MNPADYALWMLTRSSKEQVHVWLTFCGSYPAFRAEVKVHIMALHEGIIERLESLISDWTKIKSVVTWILKYKKILIWKIRHQPSDCAATAFSPTNLDVSLFDYAQQEVIRLHQQQIFSEEMYHLRDGNTGDRKSWSRRIGIYNLDPYIEEKGLLKVPGRMKKSSLHLDNVHPVLRGKNGNITRLTVKWCHKKVAHAGKGLIKNEIRCNGFRVVRCSTTVRSLIGKCHMPITAR